MLKIKDDAHDRVNVKQWYKEQDHLMHITLTLNYMVIKKSSFVIQNILGIW